MNEEPKQPETSDISDAAIDAIVEVINEHVNIPFLNEEQEALLIRLIVTLIVRAFPKKN